MRAALFLVAIVLLAGCTRTAPQEPEPALERAGGGGSVTDTPAVFHTFAVDHTVVENDGASVVLVNGTVFDANAETNIAYIRAFVNGSALLATNHTVTSVELAATTEPTTWPADNMRVWTGASAVDGVLYFRWRCNITARYQPGYNLVGATATNPTGVTNGSALASLNVTNWSSVTVQSVPVNATGANVTGSWGAWDATPNATNATAANYLKITNTGYLARPRVLVDFNELVFTGVNDSAYTVTIPGNVAFASYTDTTPSPTSPNEGLYAYATSSDGTVSLQPTKAGDIIYVSYQIAKLPAILAAQSYSATFTATDLGTGDDGVNAHPDLVVTSIVVTPAAPKAPATVTFTVTIRNVGTQASSAGNLTFDIAYNGVSGATFSTAVPALAIGATASVTSPSYATTTGSYVVQVTADSTNAMVETVETNNALSIPLTVK